MSKQLSILGILMLLSLGANGASDNSETFQVKLKCANGKHSCKQKIEKSGKTSISLESALQSAEQDMLVAQEAYTAKNY